MWRDNRNYMFEITARLTTNSNISNYISTKEVFRIISLLIDMSTETVEPRGSIYKVGRNTIDKRKGNEGQDRAEDNEDKERAETTLKWLNRWAVLWTILVWELNGSFQIRLKILLKATSIRFIDGESSRHREHPYKERQYEQNRNVKVWGLQSLKLQNKRLAFLSKSWDLKTMSSLSERL